VLALIGMVAVLVRLTSASGTPQQAPLLAAATATATATATAPPFTPIPSVIVGTVQPGPTARVVFGTPPPAPPGSVRNSLNTPAPAGPPLPCEGDYVRYKPYVPLPTPPAAAGQPNAKFFVATQPPPTTATPTIHGPFRLIPMGYTQPLHVQQLHCPSPTQAVPLRHTEDANLVRQSSLFRQPSFVPAGYQLAHLSGGGFANTEQTVDLGYEGPGFPIEITITRLTLLPVDVDLPPADGSYPFIVEQAQVAGVPAIVDHQAFRLDDDVHVQFVQGEVLYKLAGQARTLGDVPTLRAYPARHES